MLKPRLILAATAAGLATGALAWWVAGGRVAAASRLDPIEQALALIRTPRSPADNLAAADAARAAATPLFILTTGPGAVPPPIVRLDGLSRHRGRAAALVSVNDGPAQWLTVGDANDGVVLQAVTGAGATVDTIYGPQQVALGGRIGGSAAGAPAPSAAPATPDAGKPAEATILDQTPPGFRSPPPPASAPGRR